MTNRINGSEKRAHHPDGPDKNCESCKWWIPEADKSYGTCRGGVPMSIAFQQVSPITNEVQEGMRSRFPLMPKDGWCGCHKPKTTAPVINLVQ